MRKLRLDLDELAVQSFSTASASVRMEGTVLARQTNVGTCETCNYTCNETCDGACTTTTGHDSMQTACLDCFSEGLGCTQYPGCHTVIETCFPCG
jgi:hypothetical protein